MLWHTDEEREVAQGVAIVVGLAVVAVAVIMLCLVVEYACR